MSAAAALFARVRPAGVRTGAIGGVTAAALFALAGSAHAHAGKEAGGAVSMAALFALVAVGIVGWWLFARQLTAKPWEKKQGEADNQASGAALALAPQRVGLWLLLAVITSFFGLLISAYGMRMKLGDWRPVAVPGLLWLNTGVLVASSAAFQWTRHAVARGNTEGVRAGLALSGLFAFAFLAGQLLAWQQLSATGQFLTSNAAAAFFYLLTGLHGLHLAGGLVVWGRSIARLRRPRASLEEVRLAIELCTVYWHFLLIVWLVLFAVLASGNFFASALQAIRSAFMGGS